MSRRSRSLASALALAALLSACGQPARPGVRVRSVATDLGLGVVLAQDKTAGPIALPPLEDLPIYHNPVVVPPPALSCRNAGQLDFPEEPATPNITSKPEEGIYRWKYDIQIKNREEAEKYFPFHGGLPAGNELRTYGVREVRAVTPDIVEAGLGASGETFDRGSFDYTVDTYPGLGIGEHTIQRGDTIRVQPSSYADTDQTAGDQGEGVSLLITGWSEGERSDPATFKSWLMVHAPPLQLISLPVNAAAFSAGAVVTGVTVENLDVKSASSGRAVDAAVLGAPNNPAGAAATAAGTAGPQMSFVLNGQVMGRRPIDACGDMVDSWFVDADMTIMRDATVLAMDYDYGIATQLGGLVVYERFAIPKTDPVIIIESSIGQLHPFPVSP